MNDIKSGNWQGLSPGKALVLTLLLPSMYLLGLVLAWFAPKEFGFGVRGLVYTGLTVGLSGMVLWIASMIQLGPSLSVLPGSDRLVTRGVFRFCRHPVYLGITLAFLGLFLAVGSTVGMAYLFVVVMPLNLLRARWEETALLEKFGDQYRVYRKQTWF